MRSLATALAVLAALAVPALAQPADEQARAVALLPLDADAKLELFGQPVASEVARALVQGGLEVVVVGPKMAVPGKARIVVDGTIKAGKGTAVELSVRLRDVRDGGVLDTIPVEAQSMTTMDRAAEELSAKVLPSVKTHLAALIEKDRQELHPKHVDEPKHVEPPASRATVLAAIFTNPKASAETQQLRTALETALAPWALHRHHATRVLDIHQLGNGPKTVVSERADVAVELDVLSIEISRDAVPLARARVHVKIVDPQAIVFDRVIVTDTIVGEKGLDPVKLTERVAREVLSIADPQLKRRIPTWY
ncbi:MAG TPA: hypothetical protein VFQ65_23365 [Kofleriaceae bacterium]|nr:hypothetical protein [Kofleriaceae bacterium]